MTYGIYLSLSDLLSMVISRLIHIAVNGINSSFVWLSTIPLYTYTKYSLSIHLLMGT